jgi:hypothetical protein
LKGVPAWKAGSLGKPIVPMAGEVDVVTVAQIHDYGNEHFYTDNGKIPVVNLAAMQAL